jgi:transcription initiation factor IIE alpha subunit
VTTVLGRLWVRNIHEQLFDNIQVPLSKSDAHTKDDVTIQLSTLDPVIRKVIALLMDDVVIASHTSSTLKSQYIRFIGYVKKKQRNLISALKRHSMKELNDARN